MSKSKQKPPKVDITNCDRELIHIPGAILPHGALLVLEAETLKVLQAAGDTLALLGVAIQELLGRSAATLFRSDQVETYTHWPKRTTLQSRVTCSTRCCGSCRTIPGRESAP